MTTTECPNCGQKISRDESRCPACGVPVGASARASEPSTSILRSYFSDVWLILTKPSSFFRKLPLSGGLGGPLAFALVTHWIGKAGAFLWHSAIGGGLTRFANRFLKMAGDWDIDHPGRFGGGNSVWLWDPQSPFGTWLFGMGSVVIDPFVTLFSILFTSAFVFAGARIFVSPGQEPGHSVSGAAPGRPLEITYESAVRLVCFGMTPSILAGLPLFGWGLSSLLTIIVTVIGAKEIYRVGAGRAIVIALFPRILLVSFFLLGFVLIGLFLAKFLTSLL